ncbi:hypothetical protein RF11_00477 [Thelohanellus kitauei]|uniref:Uncharacterized protein n=1 Tax=Thelohanellus kitauei TaxID=669202 RepID=A0A0C2MSD6_THEKT|nr:hypothetical protein RF11_00477 [Thelohanellus kitauei]
MENSQIIEDFAFNVERSKSSNRNERKEAEGWMHKFIEEEGAVGICLQILNSSLANDIKLKSIEVIQIKHFVTDAEYLKLTFDTFWQITRIFPNENVLDSSFHTEICKYLHTADPENTKNTQMCIQYIGEFVCQAKSSINAEIERKYRFYSSLVMDFRRYIEPAVKRNDYELFVMSIIGLPSKCESKKESKSWVLCTENMVIYRLAEFLESFINMDEYENNYRAEIKSIIDFHSKIVLKEIKESPPDDSSRFVFVSLKPLRIFMNRIIDDVDIEDDDYSAVADQALNLCLEVIRHFKENEELCNEACNLMPQCILCFQKFGCSFECVCFYLKADCKWILEFTKAFYGQIINFLQHKDQNNRSILTTQLLALSQQMLCHYYEDALLLIDVGMLINVASDTLFSQNKVVDNLPSKIIRQLLNFDRLPINRFETKIILNCLYKTHMKQLIKNCFEAIMFHKNKSVIEISGEILNMVNKNERYFIGSNSETTREHIYEIWKNHSHKISSDRSILEDFIHLLNKPYPLPA